MQKIKVEEKDDGKKLTTFLTTKYSKLNINNVYKALRQKDIKINSKRVNKDLLVKNGDDLEVYISDELLYGTINDNIQIVYEDKNIVIFDKPKGIEVEGPNSLTERMMDKYAFLMPCHRIDRNTTGIVVFAKNMESVQIIEKQFKNNNVDKHYIACCYGKAKSNDILTGYLFKDRKKSLVYISKLPKKGYVSIKTSYKLIDYNSEKNLSLLDVTLHTGKTHQIRAHLAFNGLPILGDGKYGSYKINKKYKVYTQELCSYSIQFNNIESQELEYLNGRLFQLKKIPFNELFNN